MFRRIIQILVLAAFIGLLSLPAWPPSSTKVEDAFLRIDPLLSLQAVLSSGVWVSAAWTALLVLLLTLLLGRFFCGWVCPMGTTIELCDRAVHPKLRKWKNAERRFRWVKYAILLAIVVVALFGESIVYLFDPITWITRLFTYALYPLFAIGVNLGLDLLRPLFEWIGWMGLARTTLDPGVFGAFGLLTLAFFAFIIWLGRYQHRFWCRCLCPLGGLLGLVSRFSIVKRRVTDACDQDGRCAITCHTGAIDTEDKRPYDAGECIMCQACVPVCHKDATSFGPTLSRAQVNARTDMNRRRLLGAAGLGVVGAAFLGFNSARHFTQNKALRPPGAIPEADFLATCVRCGQCIEACPTHCLHPAALEAGAAGFMSPVAIMRIGACDQNCAACGNVCPTDAIRSLNLTIKPRAKIGNAVIEPGRCVVWEQGKSCLVCDEHCTYGAIYWEANAKGERRPFVDEDACNGCGQCEHSCPVDGTAAIRVFPAGQVRLAEGDYPALKQNKKKNEFKDPSNPYGYP